MTMIAANKLQIAQPIKFQGSSHYWKAEARRRWQAVEPFRDDANAADNDYKSAKDNLTLLQARAFFSKLHLAKPVTPEEMEAAQKAVDDAKLKLDSANERLQKAIDHAVAADKKW